MRRSEVYAWLQAHGGQRPGGFKVDYEEVKNPDHNPNGTIAQQNAPTTIRQKVITWVANDGLTLTVMDDSAGIPAQKGGAGTGDPGDPNTPVSGKPGAPPSDPEYEYRGEGKAPRDSNEPVQTPYQAATSTEALRQAQANKDAGKGFYTDAELEAQAARKSTEDRAAEDQQMQRDARLRQIAIDERAAKTQDEANRLAQERLQLERENAAATHALGAGSLAVSQAAEARQEAQANRPTFLSTADPGNKNIAIYDPVSGNITSTANPNYDAVKADAERLQKDLALGIQLNQYSAQEAKTKYDQWFQENVSVPFMAAQEERARAADARAAMQAEEQRGQFAADFGLKSAEFGETAGQHAAQNEISLLPYRVGGTFGAEMSSAINSLAAGGKVNGPSPSAGINFSPGAFTFKRPDFEGIAAKATAKALAHLTPYRPTEGSFPTVGTGGTPTPNFSSAPKPGPGVDLTPLINQFTGKYTAPAAAPTPPVPPPDEGVSQYGQ